MKDVMETLQALQNTPVPNLLVIAGFILLLLAFAGKFGAFIELPKERQKLAGIIGSLLLIFGVGLFMVPGSQPDSTPPSVAAVIPDTPTVPPIRPTNTPVEKPSDTPMPEPLPTPTSTDGWVGTIVKLAPGSQYDDYFERDDEQRFGIEAIDATVEQQIKELRWTGAQVQVWGQLLSEVPDVEGRQIKVERIEAISGPAMEVRNLSPFASPSASSVFPPDRWGTYHALSAIDGTLSTPWVEGVAGPGIGEWIMLTFPGTIEVHRIGLDVGYDRDEDIFFANNRLKRATITFSNGDHIELAFFDTRGVQMRDIAPVATTSVKVVIDEVYPGSRYEDTCLAEIEVWGRTQ